MKNRILWMLKITTVASLLLFTFFLPLAGQAAPASIAVQKISADLYLLKAADYNTNIGVIRIGNSLLLIDPMPEQHNLLALQQQIQTLFQTASLYILNTHAHDDHTGGNAFFVSQGAVVLTSAETLPDIQLQKLTSHSDSDQIIVHLVSNSIFVGDIYDTSWHPTFYAGGVSGFVQAIDSILQLADEKTLIIPGHGKATDKLALQQYKQHTLDWVEHIKKLQKQGKTVAQIMADEQTKQRLAAFHPGQTSDYFPAKALQRFIERTLTVIKNES